MSTEMPMKKLALVPITRRARGVSCAPIDWAMRMLAAMPMPNTEPIRKNMMLLALAAAVSAFSPRKRPTQTALTEPLSDWATLPPRIGNANSSRLRPMGPVVRSRPERCAMLVSSCRQAHTSTGAVYGAQR